MKLVPNPNEGSTGSVSIVLPLLAPAPPDNCAGKSAGETPVEYRQHGRADAVV